MPAPGKPFDLFVAEDRECRGWAERSIGTSPTDNAAQNFVGSAVLGTAIGAAVGGLAGGNRGAGTGAAAGLAVGSLAGSGEAAGASWDAQRRYDIAYQQCMYSKGNQIPGYRHVAPSYPPASYPPPPPRRSSPPPDRDDDY
jgi:hypothetical protein